MEGKGGSLTWLFALAGSSVTMELLRPGGLLTVCVYPGHPAGDEEREKLTEMLSAVRPQEFNVLHQRFINAGPGAPECFLVQKQGAE